MRFTSTHHQIGFKTSKLGKRDFVRSRVSTSAPREVQKSSTSRTSRVTPRCSGERILSDCSDKAHARSFHIWEKGFCPIGPPVATRMRRMIFSDDFFRGFFPACARTHHIWERDFFRRSRGRSIYRKMDFFRRSIGKK